MYFVRLIFIGFIGLPATFSLTMGEGNLLRGEGTSWQDNEEADQHNDWEEG